MNQSKHALILTLILTSVSASAQTVSNEKASLMVLGIAQDAGFPQADCEKSCCAEAWKNPALRKMVSCLALVDHAEKRFWIFDATPDFKDQLRLVKSTFPGYGLAGIFLTHAHIGHYTGLMHLGHEVMGAKHLPVYAMPRMQTFLSTHGPWSQLVEKQNIQLMNMANQQPVELVSGLSVTPMLVPHRDEFSETVGFRISSERKSALFIPDIDKWAKWEKDIREEVNKVDLAFLDATFYENGEIPGRDMSLIPHPFVEESMALLGELGNEEKTKIHFIHFNHTNPLLQVGSAARELVKRTGFNLAEEGRQFPF